MAAQSQRLLWALALIGTASAWNTACRPSSSAAQKPVLTGPQPDAALVKNAGIVPSPRKRQVQRKPQAPKTPPGLNLTALAQQWSKRQAASCKVQLQITQGTSIQGSIRGRIAWSRATPGAERLKIQLQGTLGDTPCKVRASSMGQGIMLEHWNPALHYATTRRHPAQVLPITSMTQLATPMVVSALQQGCTPLLTMPPAASQWTPVKTGPNSVTWSTPQGATQTLWVDKNKAPQKRELQFKTPQAQTIRWTLLTQCQST